MKKIIIAISLFILFLGLYIYLNHYVSENKEGFEPNVFLDNTLRDSFTKSIEDIKNITPYNEINVNEIKEFVKKELKIGDDYKNHDELHNLRETGQNDKIKEIEGVINNLSKTSLFMGLDTDKITNFRSIKSKQNSQPINLTPLSNSKYLIHINDKCLENNSLNKTSIQPCNLQNPNQYFTLNFVNNDTDYRKYTIEDIFDLDPKEKYKYPFTMVKSDSGNCVTNTDSYISVQPCNKLISQRWDASSNPIICGMKND